MSINVFEKRCRSSKALSVKYGYRLRKKYYTSKAVPCVLSRERISYCLMLSAPILLAFLACAFASM